MEKISLTIGLAVATQALLGINESDAAGFGLLSDDSWETEAALLLYSETDRVTAAEPVIRAKLNLDTDESITFKLTLDSLTGVSGSGAVPASAPVTFTQPSGNGNYTIAEGQTPLDPTFRDGRAALSVVWAQPSIKGSNLSLGVNASKEYDYTSLSASSQLSIATLGANTTWSVGLSFAADTIEPVGGAPEAFSTMQAPGIELTNRSNSESKNTSDLLFGVTQVIDRQSLVQFNIGFSHVSGYQTDPYKFISIVDETGEIEYADPDIQLPSVVFENRPDTRQKQSFYARYKRDFDGRVLDTSYRFTTDDWGVVGHTVDLAYRVPINERYYWMPRLRLYNQQAADFYTPFLVDGSQAQPGDRMVNASADYRLSDMQTTTIGLEFGRYGSQRWSVALEYYLQQLDEPTKIGILEQYELTPDVNALMLRLGATF